MKHPSVIYAAAVTLAAVIILAVLGAPLQASLGMTGLALTELMILAVAIAGAAVVGRLTGEPAKSFFPIRAVSLRQLLGSFVIYIGAYFVMYAAAVVLQYLFPAAAEEAEYLTGFTTSVPLPLGMLITAVMPAVCEEALHRGVILRCVRGTAESVYDDSRVIARSALVTIAGGALFGLFHLDPYRFLTTAVLGGAFSYVCFKTGSMLPGMLLHLLNNAFSVMMMYAEKAQEAAAVSAE